MALRNFLSKSLFNIEKDLSRSVATEMSTVPSMVDNMLAPQVYAYQTAAASASIGGGAFQSTGLRSAPAAVVKVMYPIKKEGLFQDPKLSFHK
jgi:sensor domain CHASE-containing protein